MVAAVSATLGVLSSILPPIALLFLLLSVPLILRMRWGSIPYIVIFLLSITRGYLYFRDRKEGRKTFVCKVVGYFGKGYVLSWGNRRAISYISPDEEVHEGNILKVEGDVEGVKRYIYISNGINCKVKNIKILKVYRKETLKGLILKLRKKLYINLTENLGYEYGNIISGITIGRVVRIHPSIERKFRNSGIMHLLAVSGLHVGAILFILLLLIKLWNVKRGRMMKFMAIALPLITYTLITGARHSVIRASIMGMMLSLSTITGRKFSIWNAMGHALWLNLLIYPWALLSPGFQLSYVAVASIYLFFKIIPMKKKNLLTYMETAFLLSIFIQINIVPLLIIYFGGFSPLSPVTNIPATLILSVGLPLSLIVLGVSLLYPGVTITLLPVSYLLYRLTALSMYMDVRRCRGIFFLFIPLLYITPLIESRKVRIMYIVSLYILLLITSTVL